MNIELPRRKDRSRNEFGINTKYDFYIGKKVQKVSGKTFKNGEHIVTVHSVGTNPITKKPAFWFEGINDDYCVDCHFCMPADGEYYVEQIEWLREVSKHIPKMGQRQDSTVDQLRDLQVIANRLGCYDAADFIRQVLQK